LPERFIVKKLFGWTDKRYNQEYWKRLERSWNRWKKVNRRIVDQVKEELCWKRLRKKKK